MPDNLDTSKPFTGQSLVGNKYGRLTVVEFAGWGNEKPYGKKYWKCSCDCGSVTVKWDSNIKNGTTQSCGCLQKERASEANTVHGLKEHPLYATWCGIKQRCKDPGCKIWKYYGGRGISVCKRWDNSFTAFLEDMESGWMPGLSIERKNNDKNYDTDNCRWATDLEQANNKRGNRRLDFNGLTKTCAEWSRSSGIPAATIHTRLRDGWTVEETLTISVENHCRKSSKALSQSVDSGSVL
jgi:hypothetical protein